MAILNSTVQRFILPFSTQTAPFSAEVEAAAVFALAEFERNTGRGLLVKQPDEKLLTLTKMGYPVWMFPKNNLTFIFDGLNDSPYDVSYAEAASAKTFMINLQASVATREDYSAFLANNGRYFEQPMKGRQFTIKGLIADADFKKEFNAYSKEALEPTNVSSLMLLSPILEVSAVASAVDEINKVYRLLVEDAERLGECRRQVNQTTSQYITELEFESQAAAEEANAKIRAQEELVKPQVAKLNSQYKHKIRDLEDGYDAQIVKLKKLKIKTQKYLKSDEAKIRLYDREAKAQAAQHHQIYEKRWKEKSKKTEKEYNALKHELSEIEKNIENLLKQKKTGASKLDFELNSQVRLTRQPLLDLEAARDAKMLSFKQETDRLIRLEKPVVEGINGSIKVREPINAKFQTLGIQNQQLKNPVLFYVPFYAAHYEWGTAKRYLTFPPSIIAGADFSAKLKGVFSFSKIRDLLNPSFKAISPLVRKVPWLTMENIALDKQLRDLAEKGNLMKNAMFIDNAQKGLFYLQRDGWVLDKEYDVLSNRLTAYKSG